MEDILDPFPPCRLDCDSDSCDYRVHLDDASLECLGFGTVQMFFLRSRA